MRKTIAAAAIALALAGCAPATPAHSTLPEPRPGTDTITEDDPRWNCETMGNKQCGPTAVDVADVQLTSHGGGVKLPAGRYRRVPRRLRGVVVRDLEGERLRVSGACVWRPGGTSWIVCPHGVVSS